MEKAELDLIIANARTAVAEGALALLVRQLSELTADAYPEQIAEMRRRMILSMEELAHLVERDVLQLPSSRIRPEEEWNLLADELRLVLEELKTKIEASWPSGPRVPAFVPEK